MAVALALFLLQVPDPAGTAQFEPLYRAELAAKQASLGAADPRTLQALRDLALYLKANSKPDEARTLLRQLAATRGVKPDDLFALAELVEPPEAIPLLESALKMGETPEAHHRLANLYGAVGQVEAVRAHLERAVALYEKAPGPGLGVALNDLGFYYENKEQFKEAETWYRRALAAQQKAHGAKHPEVGTVLNNLGSVVGAQGRAAEAEPLIRRALAVFEETLGPVHDRVAACAANLADLLAATGRAPQAKPLYDRAIRIYEQLGRTQEAAEVRARR